MGMGMGIPGLSTIVGLWNRRCALCLCVFLATWPHDHRKTPARWRLHANVPKPKHTRNYICLRSALVRSWQSGIGNPGYGYGLAAGLLLRVISVSFTGDGRRATFDCFSYARCDASCVRFAVIVATSIWSKWDCREWTGLKIAWQREKDWSYYTYSPFPTLPTFTFRLCESVVNYLAQIFATDLTYFSTLRRVPSDKHSTAPSPGFPGDSVSANVNSHKYKTS